MIDQLVQQVCTKLGISTDVAEKAVGVLMGFVKKEGDSGAVNEIFSKIPGAADLASQFEGELSSSSGGGLMGKLSGMLGGKAGGAMDAMAAFQKTGLSMDQAKDMVPVAKDFLQEHAGEEITSKLMESVPALKSLF